MLDPSKPTKSKLQPSPQVTPGHVERTHFMIFQDLNFLKPYTISDAPQS